MKKTTLAKEDTADYFKRMEENIKPETKKKKGKYKQAEMELKG